MEWGLSCVADDDVVAPFSPQVGAAGFPTPSPLSLVVGPAADFLRGVC